MRYTLRSPELDLGKFDKNNWQIRALRYKSRELSEKRKKFGSDCRLAGQFKAVRGKRAGIPPSLESIHGSKKTQNPD
jgi:hypothetical protein